MIHNARIVQKPGVDDEQRNPFELLWEDDDGVTHSGGESADPEELAAILKQQQEAEVGHGPK